jgi:hypothetical protein
MSWKFEVVAHWCYKIPRVFIHFYSTMNDTISYVLLFYNVFYNNETVIKIDRCG